MNSILTNEILDNKDELKEEFNKTFYCLKKNLEEINNQSLVDSLLSLDYKELVEFDKEFDDYEKMKEEQDIYIKNQGVNNFKCICGKQHLKYLNIFSHNECDKNIIIGSSCVKEVEKLIDIYTDNQQFVNFLTELISEVKETEKSYMKKKTHKPCYKCGDLCIKLNYDYKFKHMNNYCRSCLLGKNKSWVKCKRCFQKVIPASQKKPFGTGFKDICGGCWHKDNREKSWYKNKY